jgi:hypothetical protein
MISRTSQIRRFVTASAAVLALACAPERASAQWGFGGFGYGWGGFHPVPSPQIYLNQKSLIDAQRDTHIPTRQPYANNPNSYINRIRDNGFVPRYAVDRREAPSWRYTSASGGQQGAGPMTLTAAEQRPVAPLDSFYNAERRLVWPSDAPTDGELKAKRTAFDQASQAALTEKKQNGVASMAAVTEARNKLLDYGRLALEQVKTRDSPRVADSLHQFLLALYDSLAQAAIPAPQPGAGIQAPRPAS